ncbi:MAG: endolytic transglycosylase MltG [Myxococcota bacterium]
MTCVVLLIAFLGFRRFAAQTGPAPRATPVNWPEGMDPASAAQLLQQLGLIDAPGWMEAFLARRDAGACFVAGPHLLPARATPNQILAALCRDPDRARVKVTLVEGFHRFAMARRLEDAGVVSGDAFLHATEDPELLRRLGVAPAADEAGGSAEGFLFPATYQFSVDAAPETVVARLVGEMSRRVDHLIGRHRAGWLRLTEEFAFDRRDLLTLASIVEKEAAVADERATIASVFLNRLRDPEFPHLQSDPTAMYGCLALGPEAVASCRRWNGKASGAINRDPDNRFSTYVTPGLPPGPIANPGAAAIEAVLAPKSTTYRFFVARGRGRHTFSETYDEHRAAIREARRRGRSSPNVAPGPGAGATNPAEAIPRRGAP